MGEYEHPEVVVDTEWVAEHLADDAVVIVEVDVDTAAYDEGHVPGALGWNWQEQLCDPLQRDILSREAFAELMSASGIRPDQTLVLYGDNNNWFAAWAFWQAKIYGHADVRLMNGGRSKWLEEGRELSLDVPQRTRTQYTAEPADESLRSLLPQAMAASGAQAATLIDVRSPMEYSGELLAPPGLPETCQRGGHIPGAKSVPWGEACKPDGTFKSYDELKQLYEAVGVRADRPAIAYCRIGERSSHTWFVLKYLLGVQDVRNYDGSWTEWGNLVGAPIERSGTP